MDNTQNIADIKENSLALAEEIVKILDANKAGQLKLLRVNDQTVMTDYFVICTGNSNTHIKSLSGEVEFKLGEKGVSPAGIDGYESGIWIVMDYGTVMVHIFNREQRDFFKLEKLWADAEDISLESIVTD
ncbi:MAG: ribosome silencing factor [Clostridia bacterium]|nr:ribosome silencing factor [Clostridia bacterium]